MASKFRGNGLRNAFLLRKECSKVFRIIGNALKMNFEVLIVYTDAKRIFQCSLEKCCETSFKPVSVQNALITQTYSHGKMELISIFRKAT